MVQLFDPSSATITTTTTAAGGDGGPGRPGLDTTGFFCAKFVKTASVFDDDEGGGGSE